MTIIETNPNVVPNALVFVLVLFNWDSVLIELRGYLILCDAKSVLNGRTLEGRLVCEYLLGLPRESEEVLLESGSYENVCGISTLLVELEGFLAQRQGLLSLQPPVCLLR
jgi:hypothetical protein